jgi:hypothetical protein
MVTVLMWDVLQVMLEARLCTRSSTAGHRCHCPLPCLRG